MVRVVIREVVIQLFKGLDKQENPYLMFRADRLRLDAAVTEHGVAAHASLGAIQLVDKIHIGTVSSEIFPRILFLRIALKDIFATLKSATRA